jgi:hypothetical protein
VATITLAIPRSTACPVAVEGAGEMVIVSC